MIRVVLPAHLRELARTGSEVAVEVNGEVTQRSVLDAIRDHETKQRRAFVRFFACMEDLSNDPPDTPLPPEVAEGKEPYLVIGALAGG